MRLPRLILRVLSSLACCWCSGHAAYMDGYVGAVSYLSYGLMALWLRVMVDIRDNPNDS